jgi:hypothetical protein
VTIQTADPYAPDTDLRAERDKVAVPVFEWVGRRIVAVDAQIRAERAA